MIRNVALPTAVVAALFMFACGSKKSNEGETEKATSVTVDIVQPRDLEIKSVFTGTLEGLKQAQIFASIPEAVVELPVPEGAEVKAGQPVIMLDKEGSYSRYNQSRAVYVDAKDNYEKMKRLYGQGAISEQAFNGAKTAYDVALANYTSARQQVELTSPINGILTDLSVNIGEFVPLGVALATIAQTNRMRMTVYVDGTSIANIRIGQKAAINVDVLGQGSPQFSGRVTEVSKSADMTTRLFKVEIQVDNKDRTIKPGMFARAILTVADLKSVMAIDREALFAVEGVPKVYAVEEGRAREKTVEVGNSTDELAQILSGVNSGDTVIVIGRNLVEDGSLVRVASDVETDEKGEMSATEPGSEG